MKKILSLLLFAGAVLGLNALPYDLHLSQTKASGVGNIERNINAASFRILAFDAAGESISYLDPSSGIPLFITSPTLTNLNAALTAGAIPNTAGTNAFSGANSFSAATTFTGAIVTAPTTMSGTSIDVTKTLLTRALTGNETETFSATPAPGTWVTVEYTADGTNRIVTPDNNSGAVYFNDTSAVGSTFTVFANTTKVVKYERQASRWAAYGTGVTTTGTGAFVQTAAPTITDLTLLGTTTGGAPGGSGSDTYIVYNNSGSFGANSGLTVNKTSGALTQTQTALGTTITNGVTTVNSTAAANGAQQQSPAIVLRGNGWNSSSSASQPVDFAIYNLPVQNAGTPSGIWRVAAQANNGGYTTLLSMTSAGAFTISQSGLIIGTNSASIAWSGRSSFVSPADGEISMRDSGGTSFTMLNFGTNSSSNPALRRVAGSGIGVRLADNSAPGYLIHSESISANASTPVTVTAILSGTVYTNEGASAQIVFNLPTAVAGYMYRFIVQDADGVQVVASTGDTIRIAGSVSASAGNITSTTVGSTVTLVAINSTEWISVGTNGSWTVN